MKNRFRFLLTPLIYLVTITLTLAQPTGFQTIRRVNNNPGVTGVNVYTTIQAAHDAAANGDIIYVEPSVNDYGFLVCTKRLTIIGNGYFLSQNTNVSFDSRQSRVPRMTFNYGSANSVVKGISISGITFNTLMLNADNITISRCFVDTRIETTSIMPSNITITQSVITGSIVGYGGYAARNFTITNNIIGDGVGFLTNSSIINNTFLRTSANGGNGVSGFGGLTNSTIANNLFMTNYCNSCTSSPLFDGSNSGLTISNNIVVFSGGPTAFYALPANNGNINNGNLATTFVGDVTTSVLLDKNYQLAPSSPARGIGTGGTDAGAFGGATPYVLAGQPNVPIITNFTTAGAGNSNTPLTVTIGIRSNN